MIEELGMEVQQWPQDLSSMQGLQIDNLFRGHDPEEVKKTATAGNHLVQRKV